MYLMGMACYLRYLIYCVWNCRCCHSLRKDETEWVKFQAKKSKRQSMMHVVSVQHMKEQNAKGDEWLWLHVKQWLRVSSQTLVYCEINCFDFNCANLKAHWEVHGKEVFRGPVPGFAVDADFRELCQEDCRGSAGA